MTQYVKRKIEVTFNLGEGTFGENRGPDVTLSGHRVSASLSLAGGSSQSAAHLRIFGMPLEMMNRLTRIGTVQNQYRVNSLLVAAGDEGGALSTVHMGTIETAYPAMNSAPEVAFEVISRAGLIEAIRPVGARSYKGATDAASVMSDLAASMSVSFKNNGVSVILQNPYFPGTAWEQVKACAAAARIDFSLDRGVLAIWPRGGSRGGSTPIRVAADTGMVGYPIYNSKGVVIRTLFNPDVVLGSDIEVESELTPANGKWHVYSTSHSLESETPNGQWFTDLLCNRDFTNE